MFMKSPVLSDEMMEVVKMNMGDHEGVKDSIDKVRSHPQKGKTNVHVSILNTFFMS